MEMLYESVNARVKHSLLATTTNKSAAPIEQNGLDIPQHWITYSITLASPVNSGQPHPHNESRPRRHLQQTISHCDLKWLIRTVDKPNAEAEWAPCAKVSTGKPRSIVQLVSKYLLGDGFDDCTHPINQCPRRSILFIHRSDPGLANRWYGDDRCDYTN